MFQPGFSCYTFKVGNVTGSLELDFGQATGRSIQITGISCSQNSTAALHTSPLTEDITVPSGEHRWIVGGTSPNNATCEGATAEAGARYKGTACVSYIESGTNTQRLVCGDINARLEPASAVQPGGSPTATPYPTPPPGAISLTECGQVYDQPGYYYTDTDMNDTDGGTCITLTTGASNSILDCYGHTIDSTNRWSGMGIHLQSATNVTVRHCTVTNFGYGILLESSNGNNLMDNTANSNQYGIFLSSSSDNTISGNTANSSGNEGITLGSSNNNILISNTANLNSNGIFLAYSTDNNLTGNIVLANGNFGIYADTSSNLLTGNTACQNSVSDVQCGAPQSEGNGNICKPYGDTVCSGSITCNSGCPPLPPPTCAPGFVVSSCECVLNAAGNYTIQSDLNYSGSNDCIDITADDVKLDCQHHSITATSGGSTGIMVANWNTGSISGVAVKNCNVNSFGTGIYVYGLSGGSITRNTAESNTGGGLIVQSSSGNNLTGNSANSNGDYGIYLDSSSSNTLLTGNEFNSNAGQGMYIQYGATGITLTGNIACYNIYGNIICDQPQSDGSGNICLPEGPDAACSSSVDCGSGCTPSPPACASGGVITSCNCIINSPGDYTLGGDLVYNSYYSCVTFGSAASGSTLDCHGHTISGISQSGYGVHLMGATGITVENCNFTNLGGGIELENAYGNTIMHNNATLNSYGIGFNNASGNTITDNYAGSNSYAGFDVEISSGNTFTGNTATASGHNDFSCGYGGANIDGGNTCNSQTGCGWLTSCPSQTSCSGTTLTDCCAITSPGSYSLGNDLTTSGTCITLAGTAGGSTLDCGGYSITRSGNYDGVGVLVQGAGGVTVQGCSISGFMEGIHLYASNGSMVEGNTLTSNWDGIVLDTLSGTTITGNSAGVFQSGGNGILLSGSTGNTVTGNNASSVQYGRGIYLLSSSNNNAISGNTVNSDTYGIYTERSDGNTISGNNASSNQVGIYLDRNSDGNTITGNTAESNSGGGMLLGSSTGNTVSGNNFGSNQYGIELYSAAGNTITGNTANSNLENGIYSQSLSSNTFSGNTICNNLDGDMSCDSTQTDGTGNACQTPDACGISCDSSCPAPEPPACASGWVVHSCPCTLFVPGDYTMDSDITYSGGNYPYTCITIPTAGSNSTLDCHGYSISRSDGNGIGINLNGASNVTITDCAVHGFGYGIYLQDSNGNTFAGDSPTGNNNDFFCSSSSSNTDSSNTCYTQNGCSDWLSSCPQAYPTCGSSITDCCRITSTGTYTVQNDITTFRSTCIEISGSGGGPTIDCHGHSITGPGKQRSGTIGIAFSGGGTVQNCSISNFWTGILAAHEDVVWDNTLSNCGGYGIRAFGGNNLITHNTATSSNIGIELENSLNTVSNNSVSGNRYGFEFYSTSGGSVANNSATGNSDNDFRCESGGSSNDLGGNICSNKDDCGWLTCH